MWSRLTSEIAGLADAEPSVEELVLCGPTARPHDETVTMAQAATSTRSQLVFDMDIAMLLTVDHRADLDRDAGLLSLDHQSVARVDRYVM